MASARHAGGQKLAFLSKTPGIGGTLKSAPEDFLVEEMLPDGTVLELGKRMEMPGQPGRFIHFILEKNNWTTAFAIREIAKRLRSSHRNFGFAGSKDKCAMTTQLASGFGINKDALLALGIRGISINGAWSAKDKVRLGDLAGNRFTIRVNGAKYGPEAAGESVGRIRSELGGRFPNYFGEQRFGSSRRNTHIVGEKIIRGDYEGAAMSFLCDSEGEENQEARLARKELLGTQDFKAALKEFPKHLKLELAMISHLAEKPGDFTGAFLALPRQTLLLFVHAFQSSLFNRLLSERMGEGDVVMEEGEYLCPVSSLGFPDLEKMDVEGWLCIKILGYNSNPNGREKALLDSLGIKKDDFRVKGIPEVGSKGTFRTAFAPLRDFSFSDPVFRFSLQSGSYATAALREFMEVDKP